MAPSPELTDRIAGASASARAKADYGLRQGVLSPMETLAQSVSTIAPTTTPVATIPLVCALAGNATWLAYLLATVAILLVAWCVGRFSRYTSSPGSLYTYAGMILPPWLGATAGWSLLLAYIATASSVIGGFYQYANLLIHDATGHVTSTALLAVIVTGISIWIAWRDVKISTRVMLWIEAVSVLFIITVVALVLARRGGHIDMSQFRLQGVTGSGLRLGLVLALFSFVGFESATTLGSEARNPLKTIPSAVLQSSMLGGAFFTLCAYRSFGISRRRQGPRYQRRADARAGDAGRSAYSGASDRYGSAGELVCRDARVHHGRGTRIDADVAPRTCSPEVRDDPREE
jgi:amino acid transporter